jgi:hypothetical protein
MSFLPAMIGPVVGSLFSHAATVGGTADSAALGNLQTSLEADSAESMLTQTALSHRTSKFAEQIWTADEHVREASLYSQFTLSVQGAEQNVIKKSMTMVDQASQNG